MVDSGMGTSLGDVINSILADSACGFVDRSDMSEGPNWEWDREKPVWNGCPRGREAIASGRMMTYAAYLKKVEVSLSLSRST